MTKIGVFTITIINLFWHMFQSHVSSDKIRLLRIIPLDLVRLACEPIGCCGASLLQ